MNNSLSNNPKKLLLVGLLVGLLLLLLFRGQWLFSNAVANPDEAELLAAGKRAEMDLLPYRTYTSATYLFLWPLFLGIIGRLGIPLTLPTAHVISGLVDLSLALTGWFLIARQNGWKWATLIVTPGAVFLFAGGAVLPTDFFAMETELLPILILLGAVVVLFGPTRDITVRRLTTASVLAGTSIWAKPQLGPLALALLASALLIRILERQQTTGVIHRARFFDRAFRRDILIIVVGFTFPSIIFLLVIVLSGTFHPFMKEGVAILFIYAGSSNSVAAPLLIRADSVGTFLIGFPYAFIWMFGGMVGWIGHSTEGEVRLRIIQLAAWVMPLLSAVFSLMILSGVFQHYGNIVYAACMFSGIIGVKIAQISSRAAQISENTITALNGQRFTIGAMSAVAVAVVSFTFIAGAWSNLEFIGGYVKATVTGKGLRAIDPINTQGSQLPELCPPGSQVLVWGWSAQLYSDYNWEPASRFVTNLGQIADIGDRNYYREVLLDELVENPPRCIVEAVGPNFFGGLAATATLQHEIPKVESLLMSCYVLRTTVEGYDPVGTVPELNQPTPVYVRRNGCRSSTKS